MKGIFNYFRKSVIELHKVSWLTQKQAIGLTVVVFIIMLLFAAFTGGLDYLLSTGRTLIMNKFI